MFNFAHRDALGFFSVNHAPNTLQLWLYLGRFYQVQLFNYCFLMSDCCWDALKEKVCTFTWHQSSRSTKFYQESTWFQSALNRDPIMGVSIDVWRRRIAGCYGSRGPTIGKKRREALPDTLPEGRKKSGKKRKDAEQVCIYKICPLQIYLFNNTLFSFGTGRIFSLTCPSLCSWSWVFNNLQHCVLAILWYWPLHWGSGLWLVQRWNNMHWFFLYLLQSYSGAKTCRWLAWRPPPSSVRSVCNTSTSTTFSPSSVQWGCTLLLFHSLVEQ